MDLQDQWRWCRICFSLHYVGFNAGSCANGGAHDPTGSADYLLAMGLVPDGTQPGWHWCLKCQCLVYEDGASSCFAGGMHDTTQSGDYAVPHESEPPGAQPGWRCCSLCWALVYAAWEESAACPFGGGHDFSPSGAYSVPTSASVLPELHPNVTVQAGMYVEVRGTGFTPDGAVNLAFRWDGTTVDKQVTADGVGDIYFEARARTGEGACLLIPRDEVTGAFTAASIVGRYPDIFPVPLAPPEAIPGGGDPRYD